MESHGTVYGPGGQYVIEYFSFPMFRNSSNSSQGSLHRPNIRPRPLLPLCRHNYWLWRWPETIRLEQDRLFQRMARGVIRSRGTPNRAINSALLSSNANSILFDQNSILFHRVCLCLSSAPNNIHPPLRLLRQDLDPHVHQLGEWTGSILAKIVVPWV